MAEPLQIVATAVTPVVMVSATAIMAGGINSRYMAIADRVRNLTREARDPATAEHRRVAIKAQLPVFMRRVHLVAWSIRLAYTAMAWFVLMALVITATAFRQILVEVTVPIFVMGIGFVMSSLLCQLLELHAANGTIEMEVKDILN